MKTRNIIATWSALIMMTLLMVGVVLAEPKSGQIRITGKAQITETGDTRYSMVIDFSASDYVKIKREYPDPYRFLVDFRSSRADFELEQGATCEYDDRRSSLRMGMTELGAVRNKGFGRWEVNIEKEYEFINIKNGNTGHPTAYFFATGETNDGFPYRGQVQYIFPKSARNVRWDAGKRIISYLLPHVKTEGRANLSVNIQVKKRLMSTTYKVYGLKTDFHTQWVAKTVLRNNGKVSATAIRIRYRLCGYSDWSPWQKFPEAIPGQTIVSVYYPVIKRDIAELRSSTPANIAIEWQYRNGHSGDMIQDSDGARIVIMGVNEFVFTNLMAGEGYGTWHESCNNAPLLAAWVSRNDPVVKEFAAIANKFAGGIGASTDNESAIKVLEAAYTLLLIAEITYQHPPGLVDRSISYDPQSVQNIKFPRDTLRDKSGTCIDLAILYAAMLHSLGLPPYLVLIPGHCFPAVILPGGQYVAVETTGVSGGFRFGSVASFEKVFEYGNKKLLQAQEDGRAYLIDLRKLWTKGVANPELASLPPDILKRWGLDADKLGNKLLEILNDTERAPVRRRDRASSNSSSTEGNLARQGEGRLFVDTKPDKARVRIINIVPKYYDGIKLDPGKYHIRVDKKGYKTKDRWVKLRAGENLNIYIELDEIHTSSIKKNNLSLVGSWIASFVDSYGYIVGQIKLQFTADGYYNYFSNYPASPAIGEGKYTITGNTIYTTNANGQTNANQFRLTEKTLIINMPNLGGNVSFKRNYY